MTNSQAQQTIRVVIAGERMRDLSNDAFRALIRDRKLSAINLGGDVDIAEWSISDPSTCVTVGRAYAR